MAKKVLVGDEIITPQGAAQKDGYSVTDLDEVTLGECWVIEGRWKLPGRWKQPTWNPMVARPVMDAKASVPFVSLVNGSSNISASKKKTRIIACQKCTVRKCRSVNVEVRK